jgi:hypothetical protein
MTSWDKEVWKDIPGFEGKYQASNLGRIRSVDHVVVRHIKGRILRPRIRKMGYPVVTLSGAGPKDVHRLVALTFHGQGRPGEQVRHLNGDRADPRAENLAWGTQSENEHDKYTYAGKRNRLTLDDVRDIRRRINAGEKYTEIARSFNVSDTTIRQIAKGETFAWLK